MFVLQNLSLSLTYSVSLPPPPIQPPLQHLQVRYETIDRCVESCEETLDIIKEEERERTVALDKFIRESEEKKK